ncbi:MAG: hypothetical protein M1812_007768 [Candelaria pacifica]|nr:MAG: hypothetical protein M1812_007768 [Candelaria pacifica]
MKTYGRKRKGLLSPFAKFQDDHGKSAGQLKQASYARLSSSNEPNGNSNLGSEMREEVEDSVEAIANALLEDTTRMSPGRSPSSSTHEDLQHEELGKFETNAHNKPLPPLPGKDPSKNRKADRKQAKSPTALTLKTTNFILRPKVTAQAKDLVKGSESLSKGKSTKSTAKQLTSDSDGAPSQGLETMAVARHVPRDVTSVSGAEELSRKIESLMAEAEDKGSETQSKQHSATNKRTDGKRPRLQRSREMLAKVKGVITDRLTSSAKKQNNKLRRNRLFSPSGKYNEVSDQASNHHDGDSSTSHDIDGEGMNIGQRLDAEGQNLGNRKIRSLTGVSIPRKPLPSQDDGQVLKKGRSSAGDPFSDAHKMRDQTRTRGITRQGSVSGLDRATATRLGYMTATRLPQDIGRDSSEVTANESEASDETNFSPARSGLVQHPNPYEFSSSPVAQSTPRIQIDSYEDDLEVPNKAYSDDELHGGMRGKKRSSSIERQMNKEVEANALLAPPPKKAKRAKKVAIGSTKGTKAPAKVTGKQASRVLAAKDANKITKEHSKQATEDKGHAIFNAEKLDSTTSTLDEPVKKPRERVLKRSAIPRPVGKSTAHERSAVSDTSDMMDIDELQLDLSEYKIGHKKR